MPVGFKKIRFTPANRLSGIGVDREKMSDIVLQRRSQLMTDSMTFAIMRDPEALAGAERINRPEAAADFSNGLAAKRTAGFVSLGHLVPGKLGQCQG